jgi:hypothetical protein
MESSIVRRQRSPPDGIRHVGWFRKVPETSLLVACSVLVACCLSVACCLLVARCRTPVFRTARPPHASITSATSASIASARWPVSHETTKNTTSELTSEKAETEIPTGSE